MLTITTEARRIAREASSAGQGLHGGYFVFSRDGRRSEWYSQNTWPGEASGLYNEPTVRIPARRITAREVQCILDGIDPLDEDLTVL